MKSSPWCFAKRDKQVFSIFFFVYLNLCKYYQVLKFINLVLFSYVFNLKISWKWTGSGPVFLNCCQMCNVENKGKNPKTKKKTETDIAKSDTSSGKKKVKTALQSSPVNVYKASLVEGPTAVQEWGECRGALRRAASCRAGWAGRSRSVLGGCQLSV